MNVQPSYDTFWRKRLDALDAVWPDFLAGHTEALHKARVASRRIREALPVVAASAPPSKVKKLNRRMRDLTRLLGPIRELDVELAMLDKEAADNVVSRSALSLVRREVASRRHELRHRLRDAPQVRDLKKLIRKLGRIADAKSKARIAQSRKQLEHEHAWRAALGTTLLRRARRLKTALDDAGPLYAPERIHAVRVATKKLRYALEIAQEAGEAGARALVTGLKREQQRLGHLHDLQALLKHVRGAEASPRAESRVAELAAYADSLELECRKLHAEFVEHRDAMFESVKEVRHQLVPSLATAHLRQARVPASSRPARRRAKSA